MATKEPAGSQTMATSRSTNTADMAFYVVVGLAAIAVVTALQVIFFKAPVEATMGIVQKIFYFHVPAAVSMYVGATVCFVGSAGYLARGTRKWDALARSGAEVAVMMGMMVLVTGPLWAAKAWGVYWTWDPRLTTSLLSILIYVAYIVMRSFAGDGDAERKFAAALGVLGAANLPIIRYSVQKWGGNHPKVISSGGGGLGHPDMVLALNLGFVAFFLLTTLLVWSRYRLEVAKNRLQEIEEEALELGLGDE
jgi:heme exporter protein C